MGSSYKGDSPGKKISRFRMWGNMIRWAQFLGLPNDGILLLAGEGGDISCLKGLGINPKKITAVDLDEENVEFCAELYPKTTVVQGNVRDAAEKAPFRMAHLDFCGGLSVENIETVARTAYVMGLRSEKPGILSITMLKGREYVGRQKGQLVPKGSRRDRQKAARRFKEEGQEIGARMFKYGRFEPRKLLKLAESRLRRLCPDDSPEFDGDVYLFNKGGKLGPLGTAMTRAEVVRQCTAALVFGENTRNPISMHCVGVQAYHSRNKKQHGTPFVSMTFLVCREKVLEAIRPTISEGLQLFGIYRAIDANAGEVALKHFALALSARLETQQIAQVLDIRPGTITAWKAHASMGSYTKEKEFLKSKRLGLVVSGEIQPRCPHWGWLWISGGSAVNWEVFKGEAA